MPLEVVAPPSGEGVTTVATTTETVLEQSFANQHDAAQSARERRRDTADNIAEQTKLLFLEEKFKMGTREAEASRRLDDNKLSENILAQRSAKNQPQGDA